MISAKSKFSKLDYAISFLGFYKWRKKIVTATTLKQLLSLNQRIVLLLKNRFYFKDFYEASKIDRF